MGLRDVFRTAAQTAAAAFGDVFSSVQYTTMGSTVYDASAGVASTTSTDYVVSMVFTTYSQFEIDGTKILPTDVKALIPQVNLTPTPTMNDEVMRIEAGASVFYEIVNIQQDPAGALWEFQLRKP